VFADVPLAQPIFRLCQGLFLGDQGRKDGLVSFFAAQFGLGIGEGSEATNGIDQEIMNFYPSPGRLVKDEEIMGDINLLDAEKLALTGIRKEEGT
jgi:hypothetical protein